MTKEFEIKMEEMTSRLPSVIPSYKDGKLYFFDDDSLEERENKYPTNYGMIPMNITLDKTVSTSITSYSIVCDGEYTLSFHTISEWYKFFNDYFSLLNNCGTCRRDYSSATEFYDSETTSESRLDFYIEDTSKNVKILPSIPNITKLWIDGILQNEIVYNYQFSTSGMHSVTYATTQSCCLDSLPFGSDRNTYVEMDRMYEQRGGKNFYEWMCNKLIPSFDVPIEYRDAWNRKRMYIPEVIETIAWLKEMGIVCSNESESAITCCDCEKYNALSGSTMLPLLTNWYNSLDIKGTFSSISENIDCFDPHIIIPINLQTSIYDLGEMSIFSEEYDLNTDYRGAYSLSSITNERVGTVVISPSGTSVELVSGSGHSYDNVYKRRLYDDEGWKPYSGNDSSDSEMIGYIKSIYRDEEEDNDSVISGYTRSRLYDLRSTNLMCDDIGNELEGIYGNSDESAYYQPPQGEAIEPIYQIGNKANIKEFSNGVYGDYLSSMRFYFKDISGNEVTATSVDASAYTSSLEAINASISKKNTNALKDVVFDDDIWCDVTYLIGTSLDSGGTPSEVGNSGVTYSESVQFVKTRREYFLKLKPNAVLKSEENNVNAHSISYPIYCYEMRQNMEDIDSSIYEGGYKSALAYFEVKLKDVEGTDMEKNFGLSEFPMLRREYMLGSSSFQNVDGDIYIDRGSSASFERHIKLGEVFSLDDLINYGNGYFKIMED